MDGSAAGRPRPPPSLASGAVPTTIRTGWLQHGHLPDIWRQEGGHAATSRAPVLLLAAFGACAIGLAAVTDQPAHRTWGLVAGCGYLLLAVTPLARRPVAPWASGLAGGAVPLGALVLARGGSPGPGAFAQPEVWVIEDAARRWLATGSPYPAAEAAGPDGFFPYLPGMALFGMPRVLAGDVWWADARLAFAAVAVAGCAVGVAAMAPGRVGALPAWLLAGNPLVGLTLATGGHDLALAGLLVAATGVAAVGERRATVAAALLAGVAAGVKPTAWPVVLVLVVLVARTGGPARWFAAAAAGPALLLCLPDLLRAPGLVVEHLVLFPAGLAAVPTPAASPLPGAWVAALPGGRAIALGLLAIAVVLAAAYLIRRPPADAAGAARFAAASLSAGMLIAPSARVGWFVVPLLLATAGSVHRSRRGHSLGGMDPATEPAPKVVKSDAEWRAQLTPAEYQVLRKAGTEPAFTGEYTDTKTTGVYSCRACGTELFRSDAKFESHCGWPSFFTPLAGEAVIERVDTSLGMRRVEVLCATCHSHLGHVFEGEGYPTPTDLRYCINSISLRLEPDAS